MRADAAAEDGIAAEGRLVDGFRGRGLADPEKATVLQREWAMGRSRVRRTQAMAWTRRLTNTFLVSTCCENSAVTYRDPKVTALAVTGYLVKACFTSRSAISCLQQRWVRVPSSGPRSGVVVIVP